MSNRPPEICIDHGPNEAYEWGEAAVVVAPSHCLTCGEPHGGSECPYKPAHCDQCSGGRPTLHCYCACHASAAPDPFKGCSEEDRAAETKHPTCAICNDEGHWISKEGVEIPCDFCMARITAENADLRARLYAARGLLRRYVRGVVECDVLLKDIFVETVDLLSRDEVKGADDGDR